MSKKRSWTSEQLIKAVKLSYSVANVIRLLGLVPAGGNYVQVNYAIYRLNLDTKHFTGSIWNKDRKYHLTIRQSLQEMLDNPLTQSYDLKRRLFEEGIKSPKCELCGWSEKSKDGRIPVELDHINGDRSDNRLNNLRVLCPNCHSLQLTHRGKNKKVS